jgi:hypothetical protein
MAKNEAAAPEKKKSPSISEGEKAGYKKKMEARAAREAGLRSEKKMPKSLKPDPKPSGAAHQKVEASRKDRPKADKKK